MKQISKMTIAAALSCASPAWSQEETATDLMTFAQGVLPVSVTSPDLRSDFEHAIKVIDGNPGGFIATPRPGSVEDVVEMVFVLPAPTQFTRLAVPNIRETPSPSQTFFRQIEVLGSTTGPDADFVTIATGTLAVTDTPDVAAELDLVDGAPSVRWVKVRFWDGTEVLADQSFFEFSELIGEGTQEIAPLSDRFTGIWDGRGVELELEQNGPVVTGCYDGEGLLNGTVDGIVMRAVGETDAGIASQFIGIVDDDGAFRGLRSTNGAPFRPYDGMAADGARACTTPAAPALGCGSIVHGIGFDFDSDVIRADSAGLIAALYDGLTQEGATRIEIVGHSSSEGDDGYNLDLSERRAASVAAALVALGLPGDSLSASGRGEEEPIASNDDEAGRSLNRRVEVRCGA